MLIVLAGGTGDLGGRVAAALVNRRAEVRAIVRRGAATDKVDRLRSLGVTVIEGDLHSSNDMNRLMTGADCVVSTLSGLRDMIIDAQTSLLEAALKAGVPRFIPSDFCVAFTKSRPGTNRNIDLRREFHERLDKARIHATAIFNGAFGVLLTAPVPIILYPVRRVLYWENPDQPMDFTTIDDVARAAAAVALDPEAPPILNIAGDRISARELAALASELSGTEFRLLRGGNLNRLERFINFTRKFFPQKREAFSAYQGMQYLRDMFSSATELEPLDNSRYPDLNWTTARALLAERLDKTVR